MKEMHGKTGTRLYNIWKGARMRCTKKYATGFADYGGRGIKFYPEWDHSFLVFEAWALSNGYRDDLTLERKEVNGDYSPENCVWADQPTQSANSRKRRASKFTFKGVDQLPGGNWRAVIQVRKVIVYLGVHPSERDAVDARNSYIRENQLPHLIQ